MTAEPEPRGCGVSYDCSAHPTFLQLSALSCLAALTLCAAEKSKPEATNKTNSPPAQAAGTRAQRLASTNALYGKWETKEGMTLEFKPEGICMVGVRDDTRQISYKCVGNELLLILPTLTNRSIYRVDGNELVVTADGEKQAFTRVAKTQPTAENRATTAQAGTEKLVLVNIAGEWEGGGVYLSIKKDSQMCSYAAANSSGDGVMGMAVLTPARDGRSLRGSPTMQNGLPDFEITRGASTNELNIRVSGRSGVLTRKQKQVDK
jgi:hypothetical protein